MTMAVWYELWTMDTGNMVADYDTEDGALAEVRAYVAAHGSTAIADWVLARNGDDEADVRQIAEGNALADLALRASTGATMDRAALPGRPQTRPV